MRRAGGRNAAFSRGPLFRITFLFDIVTEVLGTAAPSWYSGDTGLTIANTLLFLAPLGLTYALLSRRILDFGFALNRAAVFAATSVLLAGGFAALQWGASTFLAQLVHVHSLVSQGVIVVVVYYVVRWSRRNTEATVTRVFFAGRERRLRALREAARAVDDVGEPDALAAFVVDYLRANARVEASIYLQDEDRRFVCVAGYCADPQPLSADDTLAVSLRSRREPIALTNEDPLGDVAFPMLVRGRLRGILFCCAAADGDLAPDEIRELELLANRVAIDRDDLLAETLRRRTDDLQRELEVLRPALQSMRSELEARTGA